MLVVGGRRDRQGPLRYLVSSQAQSSTSVITYHHLDLSDRPPRRGEHCSARMDLRKRPWWQNGVSRSKCSSRKIDS